MTNTSHKHHKHHIHHKHGELWVCDPDAMPQIHESLNALQEAKTGERQNDPDLAPMTDIYGNTAVININGALVSDYDPLNRYFGLVSYPEIKEELISAEQDPDVEYIVMSIDSPGGHAQGLNSLAKFATTQITKPIYSHTANKALSGGQWLHSIANAGAYGEDMSLHGSISVITTHVEESKRLQDEGITVTVMRSGEYKALATPYEPLSDKAKDEIKESMEYTHGIFRDSIAQYRGMTLEQADAISNGKTFYGPKAQELGLIDGMISLDSLVNQLITGDNDSVVDNGGSVMPKKVLLKEAVSAAIHAGLSEEQAVENFSEAVEEETSTSEGVEDKESQLKSEQVQEQVEEPGVSEEVFGELKEAPEVRAPAVDMNLMDKIVDLKVELAESKKQLASVQANHQAMREIVCSKVQHLQTVLGSSPTDTQHLTDEGLVAEHNRLSAEVSKRFPVGGVAVTETVEAEDDGEVDNFLSSVYNTVRFSK